MFCKSILVHTFPTTGCRFSANTTWSGTCTLAMWSKSWMQLTRQAPPRWNGTPWTCASNTLTKWPPSQTWKPSQKTYYLTLWERWPLTGPMQTNECCERVMKIYGVILWYLVLSPPPLFRWTSPRSFSLWYGKYTLTFIPTNRQLTIRSSNLTLVD